MSEWTEKAEEKRLRYEAAVEEMRSAKEIYMLAESAVKILDVRLRGEIYGDGSVWTSERDPRILARVSEKPEVVEALEAVKAAYIRLNNSDAALAITEPRHWLGD